MAWSDIETGNIRNLFYPKKMEEDLRIAAQRQRAKVAAERASATKY